MDLNLTTSSALVLAASRGLGRAIATGLAAEGAHVTLFARDRAALEATAAAITATGAPTPQIVVGDLTAPADLARAVETASAPSGRLDILVNNCGGPPPGGFAAHDDAAWQQAFELTLLSYIRAVRFALPALRRSPHGRILNVASTSVRAPLDDLILSNVFRLGVLGLAKSLATELAPDGILVNTLGPGRIATDRVATLDAARAARENRSIDEVRAAAAGQIPLARYGTPEEFARIATFLCSPANTYLTGQALLADGGLTKAD